MLAIPAVSGEPTEKFGQYQLEKLIGKGGMGEVFRAYDTARKRPVAVKRISAAVAEEPEFRKRFQRESELAVRLASPLAIPMHDDGEINDRLYIDMRLVDGPDLAAVLADVGPLPPGRAVDIISQVADALDSAHRSGLVHRDVKPPNILVEQASYKDFVYLIDFGIARDVVDPSLTPAESPVGTLSYMAPERFVQPDGGDHLSDIYALACVFYELLVGLPPFPGKQWATVVNAHLNSPQPRPSEQRAGLSLELDEVVVRGLAKNPADRYPTAGALAAAARDALAPEPNTGQGPASQPTEEPSSAPVQPVKPRRFDWARAALLTAATGTALAATVTAVAARPAPDARATPSSIPGRMDFVGLASVGDRPSGIALTPDGRQLLVTNSNADTLSIVNVITGKTTTTVPVGNLPVGVAVTPDGRLAYVVNSGSNSVTMVDPNVGQVLGTLSVGKGPIDVAVAPDGVHAYITNFDSNSVSVVDVATHTVITTIAVGSGPTGVAVAPYSGRVYVTESRSRSMTVIDAAAESIAATVVVDGDPVGLAVRPDGAEVYLTDAATDAVSVVDTERLSLTRTIRVGHRPYGITIAPDGRRAFIADNGSHAVSVIDTARGVVIDAMPTRDSPYSVKLTADGARLFVTNRGDESVSAIAVPDTPQ